MHQIVEWWTAAVDFVQSTYHVNPYIFIGLYLASIPPYWWGLFDIARGTYRAVKKRSKREWRVIVRGVIINRLAWAMPYIYVMIAARRLPWFVWCFLAVMLACSTGYFAWHLRKGRLGDKLPGFLRRKVRGVEEVPRVEAEDA